MLDKIVNAIEPFALTVILLAGASLAGWVSFTNKHIVGTATVFCAILLIVNHVYRQVSKPTVNKKG